MPLEVFVAAQKFLLFQSFSLRFNIFQSGRPAAKWYGYSLCRKGATGLWWKHYKFWILHKLYKLYQLYKLVCLRQLYSVDSSVLSLGCCAPSQPVPSVHCCIMLHLSFLGYASAFLFTRLSFSQSGDWISWCFFTSSCLPHEAAKGSVCVCDLCLSIV